MINSRKSSIDEKVIKELLKKERIKVGSNIAPDSYNKLKKYLLVHRGGMYINDWLEEIISTLPD